MYKVYFETSSESAATAYATMAKTAAEIMKMGRNQLNRLTKDELVDTLLSSQSSEKTVLAEIHDKLDMIVSDIYDLKRSFAAKLEEAETRITSLEERIAKQDEISERQQRFMERIDRKERECNIIVLGVPDEHLALDGVTNDQAKVRRVLEAAGADVEVRSVRRLGAVAQADKSRPILVSVSSRDQRDSTLEKAKVLKNKSLPFQKIFVKKDVHPTVRQEWGRLHEAERREKLADKHADIKINYRERKLYKNGEVIDQWSVQGFQY